MLGQGGGDARYGGGVYPQKKNPVVTEAGTIKAVRTAQHTFLGLARPCAGFARDFGLTDMRREPAPKVPEPWQRVAVHMGAHMGSSTRSRTSEHTRLLIRRQWAPGGNQAATRRQPGGNQAATRRQPGGNQAATRRHTAAQLPYKHGRECVRVGGGARGGGPMAAPTYKAAGAGDGQGRQRGTAAGRGHTLSIMATQRKHSHTSAQHTDT